MQLVTYERGSAEVDRGVPFFDAIYGFAITLLITTADVPPQRHGVPSTRCFSPGSVIRFSDSP
jgi:hypothetical protein